MEPFAIVMAGGRGTRFWPLSREKCPKQCISVKGQKTLIQETVSRLSPLIPESHIFIVTNLSHADLVRKQLPQLPQKNIIAEPCGRNTAACIGLGALFVEKMQSDSVIACLPADHVILEEENFRETLKRAFQVAEKSKIVTLGIKPAYPETGYGYIKIKDSPLSVCGFDDVYEVEGFVEKPDMEKAIAYLQCGRFLWNSGIFVWTTALVMESMKMYLPELYEGLTRIRESLGSSQEEHRIEDIYGKLPSVSIDYGVMEKASNIVVMKSNFGWSDVGTWRALADILDKDSAGNVSVGNVLVPGSKNCIVYSKDRLVVGLELDGIVIIDAGDAVLVCPKDRAQDVRKVIQTLEEKGLKEYL